LKRAALDAVLTACDPQTMAKKTATKKPAKRRERDEDFALTALRVVEQATGERLGPKKKG
jgi:hypothetical protein